MALPESFQIALQRAEDERKLERETVLQKIGETVQKGVPLLSGVVAGALSRSPIIGIGTAFIADRLQQRSEEKREQRRASRLEMRQRREAAKILAAQNEDLSFRDAMQLIEKNAIEKQQELNRQREEQLLDQFGVGELQRQVVEQEAEQIGEPVQAQDQVISSTLEDTFMRIDENITGILDLLVEKFGSDEQRAERAAARQAFLDARRREELSEIARNVLPRRDEGEPTRVEESDARPSFLARIGSFLKTLFTSKFILIPIAAALATMFSGPLIDLYNEYFGPNGKFRPEIERIGSAIENRIKQATDYLTTQLRSLLEELISPLPQSIQDAILRALGLAEDDQPETPAEAADRTNRDNIALSSAVGLGVLRETPFDRTARQVRERLLSGVAVSGNAPLAQFQPTQSLGQRFISGTGDFVRRRVAPIAIAAGAYEAATETDPELYGLGDLVRDIGVPLPGGAENQRPFFGDGLDKGVDRLFDAIIDVIKGRNFDADDLSVEPTQSNLGASLNTVSGAQTALAFSPIIMPQSQSSTSIVNQRTTNMNGTAISPYASEYKFQTNRTLIG
jgi:hypothetical protein